MAKLVIYCYLSITMVRFNIVDLENIREEIYVREVRCHS